MALSRIKNWIAEVLYYADLNTEFNNILTNGAGSLSSPRTADFSLAGYKIAFDASVTNYLLQSSTNVIDFYGQSTALVRFDFSVSTPVNAVGIVASATGTAPDFTTRGSDTNIGLRIQPKGTGKVTVDGGLNHAAAAGTVDAITATYAPAVTALDDGLELSFLASGANATTTPTFAPNGLTAKTIVKGNGAALVAGDIAGASHIVVLKYSSSTDKWHIANPATQAASFDASAVVIDATLGDVADYLVGYDTSGSDTNRALVSSVLYNALNTATADTAPEQAADHVLTRDNSASGVKKVLLQYVGAGLQTIWIPAGAMTSRTTNGPSVGSTESATNKIMTKSLDFDAATQEHAQFTVTFPKSWDLGTVTAQFFWRATNTGNVVWGLQGIATSDGDTTDTAFGTGQEVTDGVTATTQTMVSAATGAITIAGTPAAGDIVQFQAYRKAADAADTCAVDALLVGVKLTYNCNVNNDT